MIVAAVGRALLAAGMLAGLSLIGHALLPRALRPAKARLLVPLSLSFGTLVTAWLMWMAGALIGTTASLIVAAALLLVALRAAPRWWGDCRRVARELRLGWLAALPLLLTLPQLALPLTDSDGLRYHVALPKLFLLEGKVSYYPWDLTGAFPQTAEMVYLLGLRMAGGETAKLIHFAYFVATLATLTLIAHRSRRTRTAAMVAPLLLAASPVVLSPAAAGFIDHVALFHVAVALHLLMSRARPAIIALPLAGAFAVKYTAAPAVAALLLIAVVRERRAIIPMVAIVAAAFAPFAIRNMMHTGDPIYPIGHALLHRPIPGVSKASLAFATQFHSEVKGVVGIPWMPGESPPDEVVGIHHAAGLFALLLVVRNRRLRPAAALVFAYLLVDMIYRVPARYLMPMILALALLEAMALAALPRRLAAVAALVVCMPALLWCAHVLFTLATPFPYLRGRVARDDYLGRVVPGYRAASFVNTLPPGGRVMALDFPAPYYFDRPWIVEGILHEPPLQQWLHAGDDLFARLRAHDVRVLVVTPGYGGGTPYSLMPVASNGDEAQRVDAFRRRLRLRARIDGVDVFEVPQSR